MCYFLLLNRADYRPAWNPHEWPLFCLIAYVNTQQKWRYKRIKTGRGFKTSDVQPPFYVRLSQNGKQSWRALHSTTFDEAQTEAAAIEAGITARGAGYEVSGLGSDRIPIRRAIDSFIKDAEKSKKQKTVNGYRLNLNQFKEATFSEVLG